ncbi:MAG: [FeFe] hydrogenase H-cluster radical SAM maturase HydE [Oscillospiraceae bacterium]|nr:[FeFe] hydrogenase H-cluster radical SAM maturase HydE [Oscillospiraceae bacterium]
MNVSDNELVRLISTDEYDEKLRVRADEVRRSIYGNDVYIRGLIEFTSCCRRNCLYCGLRRENERERYRLTDEQIFGCCETGYSLGFRTFVLQGGEDTFFDDLHICRIVGNIKERFPDCAVTLSLGEKPRESYLEYKKAGADRYLLRHETADFAHYGKLHPPEMSLKNRMRCLYDLKELGYQTGTGFMVGSPFQTAETIVSDLRFMQKLQPEMIGIGPFIPAAGTPFAGYPAGDLSLTLRLISIIRLMFPNSLIPSTTALGTIHPNGREMGLAAGANVVMPNLSPTSVRKLYSIYDNKICTGDEAAECRRCLENRVSAAGYRIVTDRGDHKK